MARSREEVRQNKAMQSILRGDTPEKRVMVGYDKKEEKQVGDKIDPISEVMKEARMPWFCPKCKKVMKKRLDNKIWFISKNIFFLNNFLFVNYLFDPHINSVYKKHVFNI